MYYTSYDTNLPASINSFQIPTDLYIQTQSGSVVLSSDKPRQCTELSSRFRRLVGDRLAKLDLHDQLVLDRHHEFCTAVLPGRGNSIKITLERNLVELTSNPMTKATIRMPGGDGFCCGRGGRQGFRSP